MTDNTFTTGRKIRIILAARGFTQTELATAIGVNNYIMSFICNDRVGPTPDQFQAIKIALDWPAQAEQAFALLAPTDRKEAP